MPELILALFVSPLVIEAAFHINFRQLYKNLIKREGLRAKRAAIAAMMRDGVISEQIYEELITEIDQACQDEIELTPDKPVD